LPLHGEELLGGERDESSGRTCVDLARRLPVRNWRGGHPPGEGA
jgi:hypothetical protein